MWDLGAVLLVDNKSAFVVDFKANVLQTETGGIGASPNGNEDDICVKLCKRYLSLRDSHDEKCWLQSANVRFLLCLLLQLQPQV